jgi:hypothetical protein
MTLNEHVAKIPLFASEGYDWSPVDHADLSTIPIHLLNVNKLVHH